MSEGVQNEMDDPEPRGREESLDQFRGRLNEWQQEQLKKFPDRKNGEDVDEYYGRKIAFSVALTERSKNAELEAKNAELEEAHAEIEEAHAEIEEAHAEIEELSEDCSVKQLLDTFKGLPPLGRNTCAKLSHNRLHANAKIKPLEPKISLDFEVNFKVEKIDGRDRSPLVKSALAAYLGEARKSGGTQLNNFNEATPSFYIAMVLKDVLNCLGIKRAEVAQEMSFFAMRPDIVVLKYMEVIVMVIEVKNQECDGNKAMNSENAAGQCLDYTYALRAIGIDTPIVCLSTYSMMRIGSSAPSIQPILKKTLERLKKMNSNNTFDIGAGENKKPGVSPDQKKINNSFEIPCDEPNLAATHVVSSGNLKARDDTAPIDETKKGDDDRVIYFSDTFDISNMFKALYLATACGCISAEISRKANGDVSKLKRNPIPNEGEVLKERWYNVVQSDSYKWTKVTNIMVTYALKTSWYDNIRIYMGDVLGMGASGKVYMSMDSVGRHFALKMLYCNSANMESFDPTEREEKKRKPMEILKLKRKEEAKRWKKIYPGYSKSIWEGILNSQICLAMPYVASIPEERRGELMNKIEREMSRIADLGFFYNEEDTRWRHIGLRKDKDQNEIIVFLDMESLEYSESLETAKQRNALEEFEKKKKVAVNKFMSNLFNRSGEIPNKRRDELKDKITGEEDKEEGYWKRRKCITGEETSGEEKFTGEEEPRESIGKEDTTSSY